MSRAYDLVVLGGGTAGLVSSVIAAGVGARVELAERLLLKEEPAAGAVIAERLAEDGVDVRLRRGRSRSTGRRTGRSSSCSRARTAARLCGSTASSW